MNKAAKKKAKIFLLDLNPASGVGSRLKRILESSGHLDIELCMKRVLDDNETTAYDTVFSGIISRFDPDIISLIPSPSHLKQSSSLFQFMSRELTGLPTVILAIENGKTDELISLLKLGVADFVTAPLESIDVLPRIWQLLKHKRCDETVKRIVQGGAALKQLIGESPCFLAELNKIPFVAKYDASVLIGGETGTGKELFAKAIHSLSPRAHKPFVPVSCGAIPVDLLENELFGHTRGAFTNASSAQPGLIEEADGGTLFFDDVDCLALLAQAKILRFLQEKEYRRLGSTKVRRADVRIIASTNRDLKQAVREGRFRQDFYYRLKVVSFMLPPLRDRREDIVLIANHFLIKYADKYQKNVKEFSSEALQKLMLYDWPGNVRELEHIVEQAVVLSKEEAIRGADITLLQIGKKEPQESFREAKDKFIAQFERAYIKKLLLAYQGNITKAAQAAHKNRRAFWELIRKHDINVRNFKPNSVEEYG